jgi:hypothetical protein
MARNPRKTRGKRAIHWYLARYRCEAVLLQRSDVRWNRTARKCLSDNNLRRAEGGVRIEPPIRGDTERDVLAATGAAEVRGVGVNAAGWEDMLAFLGAIAIT